MPGSVEQPAHPDPISFKTLTDVRQWIDNLSETDRSATPVCRINESLRGLDSAASRDGRRQIQTLLKSWGIKQKESPKQKRNALNVQQRLQAAVLVEANRLRTMERSTGSLSRRSSFDRLFRITTGRSRRRSPLQHGVASNGVHHTPLGEQHAALNSLQDNPYKSQYRHASSVTPPSFFHRHVTALLRAAVLRHTRAKQCGK